MPTPSVIDPNHYAVVSAMITPAFFLTAASSLLISSNNRLARVVDRMRAEIETLGATEQPQRRLTLETRIAMHRRRSYLVLASVRMLYAAISAFVGTSLGIAVDALLGYKMDLLPTGLAVVGVLLMFAASVCLGQEAKLGLRTLDMELKEQLAKDRIDLSND
ncbi:DUF2721 domain-containing protein [Vulcaniibacterium tengchongense]|uniref:Uncharacterized protein DUF2721 n=1 Tax=Vulcaniibacterium tengchongense TaxID=1273429 RepID=A0A3N4VJ11_9GAMM|nr:DUF2721 domain-containing protein [Vulcaniibacterium tengchongense]RPE81683.1 uncharacterized protein DUF2721 [Vulcaniibacterium tengchongense]